MDPVLTFARDKTVHFYQVTVNLSDKIIFIPVQCINLEYKILHLQWLNTRLLGILSQTEQFHLLDVRSGRELETIDLTKVRLLYQTQFYKSLATGGNVSPALSLAAEMAVYGSVTAFTNQLLVLGASFSACSFLLRLLKCCCGFQWGKEISTGHISICF